MVPAPAELAVAGPHGDDASLSEGDVLLDAARGELDRRRVGGPVPQVGLPQDLGLPRDVAVGFVDSEHGRFVVTGGADDERSVDQHRLGVAPAGNLPVKFLHQVVPPEDLAVLVAHAHEVAIDPQRVEPVAVDARRRPGASVAAAVMADWADGRRPNLLALLAHVEGHDPFFALAVAHRVEHVADDRRAAIPFAQRLRLPEQFRAALGPVLEQAGLTADRVAVWPVPRRPVVGSGKGSQEDGGEEEAWQFHHGRVSSGLVRFFNLSYTLGLVRCSRVTPPAGR